MKIFKYVFFLLLIIIIGGSIYIATLDGDYKSEESLVIQAPIEMVFNEINDYENWKKWSFLQKNDPEMEITYSDTLRGEGAKISWEGNDFKDGYLKTLEVVPASSIKQLLVFEIPFGESKSDLFWNFTPEENGTRVSVVVQGERDFWNKVYLALGNESPDKMLLPHLKESLHGVEETVMQKMEVFNINVDGVTEYGGGFYMYSTTASRNTSKALSSKIVQIIPQVAQYMKENDIQVSGSPLTVYNNLDERNGTVIMSAGIPTPNKVVTPPESNVLCGFIESQTVVKTTLKGNHNNLPLAWKAAEDYITENNLFKAEGASPFEVYVTDPAQVPNPADWVTELYIPVEEEALQQNTNP